MSAPSPALIPVARRGRDARKAARPIIEDMASPIEYIKVLRRVGRSGEMRCGVELCGVELCQRWFDAKAKEMHVI